MKEAQKIIRKPLITEKSTRQKEESRQYVFEVHRDANKIEIQSAVERLFKVKVLQVRTSQRPGQDKTIGEKIREETGLEKGHRHPEGRGSYRFLRRSLKIIKYEHEIRNSKQTQMSKLQNSKPYNLESVRFNI